MFDAAANRAVHDHNQKMHLAWHIAALQRAKKLPKLKTLIAKPAERKVQSWQEQMAVMDLWAVHMDRIARQRQRLNSKPKR